MKLIFTDSESRDKNYETARCRLFEISDVYLNFKEHQYLFETTVHDYKSEHINRTYSELELFSSVSDGKAIRKAIEKFDQFCNGWFDS
jgi:hypothetical protein